MNLSEEDKKRIQEEEQYRETLRENHKAEAKYRQEIITKKSKGKSVFFYIAHLFKWWLIVGLIIFIIGLISFIAGNWTFSSNNQKSLSPVQYRIGYASGYLATIVIPKGTSRDEIINLLNYFHSLHQKGELSNTMNGHTILSIFDDEQWVIEENYNRIIKDGSFCDHVIALYGVDSDGKESAFIGDNNCPNSEEVTF